jgi:hypothetical protein
MNDHMLQMLKPNAHQTEFCFYLRVWTIKLFKSLYPKWMCRYPLSMSYLPHNTAVGPLHVVV